MRRGSHQPGESLGPRIASSPPVLLLGTSPLMLCRAITLGRGGHEVVMLDRAPRHGGAWHTIETFGFENVEPGVHLFENRVEAYRHLESMAGVELSPDLHGFGMVGSVRLPLAFVRPVCFAGVAVKALVRRDPNRLRLSVRSAGRSVRSLRTPFRYPAGGAGSLVRSLVERAREAGVEIRLDTEVQRVELTRGDATGTCVTTDGRLGFRRVGMASRAHCPIVLDGDPLTFSADTSTTHGLLLHVDDTDTADFGYVELVGDALLRRVRDVGGFATPTLNRGERILCVQLRDAPIVRNGPSEELLVAVRSRLLRLGLLSESGMVRAHELAVYRHETVPAVEMRRIAAELGPLFLPVTTTDFAEDLVNALRAGPGADTMEFSCPA